MGEDYVMTFFSVVSFAQQGQYRLVSIDELLSNFRFVEMTVKIRKLVQIVVGQKMVVRYRKGIIRIS